MKDTFDVIMAGYQSLEPAQKNFASLREAYQRQAGQV